MDVVVIAHPQPRSAPPQVLSGIIETWKRLGPVTVWQTAGHGHGVKLARAAAERGADVVVAVGGDGTLNEVANGIAGSETALAAIPGGSTNVFARALGLPREPVAAARVLVAASAAGQHPPLGAGRIGNRLFLANAGAGVDALALAQVESRPGLKRHLGPLWFAAATLRVAMSRSTRLAATVCVEATGPTSSPPSQAAPFRAIAGEGHETEEHETEAHETAAHETAAHETAAHETEEHERSHTHETGRHETDGHGRDGRMGRAEGRAAGPRSPGLQMEAELVAVLHTGPYTYLGPWPMTLVPGAQIRRGLALVALRRLGPIRLAASLPSVLRSGLSPSDDDGVVVMPYVERVRFSRAAPGGLRYQVDGEPAWTSEPLELRYEEAALRVVDPRPLAPASAPGSAAVAGRLRGGERAR